MPESFSRLESIEIIDLKTDILANILTIEARDVLDMSNVNLFNSSNTTAAGGSAGLPATVSRHQLMVMGDALDSVNLGADWTLSSAQVTYGGDLYKVYDSNTTAAQLLVQSSMTVL